MGFLDSITGLATIFLAVLLGLCALLILERILSVFSAGEESNDPDLVHHPKPNHRRAH